MKVIVLIVLAAFVCMSSADTASGDHASDSSQFGKWRSCLAEKLPKDKKPIFDECFAKPGGTDMSKFRRGLGCVMDSDGLVKDHKVDLKKMTTTADSVDSAELKKAYETCPKDDKNASEDRAIKCIIDHLEVNCKLPPK